MNLRSYALCLAAAEMAVQRARTIMSTHSLTRLSSGLYELRMEGQFFNPHWVAAVFSALSKLKVSVVTGRAVQTDSLDWKARFELNFAGSNTVPDSVDFEALAKDGSTILDITPQLTKFEIRPRAEGVEVMLFGPDQMGFLGRCLRHISMVGLFPVEIEVNTVAGTIEDRLVLRTMSGGAVSEGTRSSLDKLFRGFVK